MMMMMMMIIGGGKDHLRKRRYINTVTIQTTPASIELNNQKTKM